MNSQTFVEDGLIESYYYVLNYQVIPDQPVPDRITPDDDTIEPYHNSDRTSPGDAPGKLHHVIPTKKETAWYDHEGKYEEEINDTDSHVSDNPASP